MIQDKNLEKKKLFLNFYRQLPVQRLAALSIAVHENTITNWKKEDQDFCDQIGTAAAQWALDNSKRVRSKEWLLERVMHDHFGDQRQDTTAPYNIILFKEPPKTLKDVHTTTTGVADGYPDADEDTSAEDGVVINFGKSTK